MYKLVTFLITGALIYGVGSDGRLRGGKTSRAGKSNTGHLVLCEKDPEWACVEDGAWGKMNYRLSGPVFRFVFNGHGLEPESMYTLIYYPDPWPGEGLICLGEGMGDEFGNVHIRAMVNTCDLPAPFDENEDGAKIWLVLSSDIDCEGDDVQGPRMVGWNPTEYLFEYDLITFDDTDSFWDDTGACVDDEE
ncbi:MAG: hypothetical protein WBE26_10545 [Phycisphaerae bacterium]